MPAVGTLSQFYKCYSFFIPYSFKFSIVYPFLHIFFAEIYQGFTILFDFPPIPLSGGRLPAPAPTGRRVKGEIEEADLVCQVGLKRKMIRPTGMGAGGGFEISPGKGGDRND